MCLVVLVVRNGPEVFLNITTSRYITGSQRPYRCYPLRIKLRISPVDKSTRAEVSPKWADPAPSNTWSLGLARVYILNGTSIGSSVFAWFTLVTDRHRYTDHATYATTGRIWCYTLRCCLETSTTADSTWLRPEHGISNDLPPTTRASPSLLSFR